MSWKAIVLLCLTVPASGSPTGAAVVKKIFEAPTGARNLLRDDAWRPWQKGFRREGDVFVCDNGSDGKVQRGISQTVELNQTRPEPIVAVAWSKAEAVGGSPNADYSLYLDLVYTDGTPLWGQIAPFSVGTHGWERREVAVLPQKPVKTVQFHMLLRRHSGRAWFRGPELRVAQAPKGAILFDGVLVTVAARPAEGFQVRDVAAGSDFVRIERAALGLTLQTRTTDERGARFVDATVRDTTGKDRAITLVFAQRIDGLGFAWLADPRRRQSVEPRREYINAARFRVGANQRLSRYPFAAVARTDLGAGRGHAIGIDMSRPAFFRVGFHSGTNELFVAYDIALTPEKPLARVRLVVFGFEPLWGFRAALARYYELFPAHFKCRTPKQGLWMPFAKISQVQGWQDFGFRFKEGNNETPWDDEHDVITFRYTEPMTWWMPMAKETPRTLEAALAQAKSMAAKGGKGARRAQALLTSGYHDEAGRFPARLLDTPWCDGAVWSMSSAPGVPGDVTDFKNKWNPQIREKLYGPKREGDLDGEYVDSSEGYVTDELNFRREHFAGTDTPLTFSLSTRRPAVFRGLIAFEYVRALAKDIHGMGKLMMANSTPIRLCWLAPLLDVMGTETNWNPRGRWRPMSDAELLYRRAICGPKPYCFLMNTRFEEFSHALVEKYMKRSLAYGMFPGFFSHNASQGHYFTRPKLYNRDRPLFKKYVPLCKRVAEAGWQPVTRARSSDPRVYVERFGTKYLTVFNDSAEPKTATITLVGLKAAAARELVRGKKIELKDAKATLTLDAEDVAVLELD